MKRKILLVEDHETIAQFMKLVLTQEGYTICDVAASGEEAIELARTAHPDLILMNIKLIGKIDGVEACKKIKKINDIPVLFVSAYTDTDTIAKAMQNDPRGYLTKPFKVAHLIRKVEKALAGHYKEAKGNHVPHISDKKQAVTKG